MRLNVLDHGFVDLRNLSGPTRRLSNTFDADDIDPANSARMSFDQMDLTRTRELDLKLCEYLIKNHHTTPFEMIECWLEMKMPIFVARQFVRHRTVSINEVSGRYITLPEEWYIPELQNIGGKPTKVKQGRTSSEELDIGVRIALRNDLNHHCKLGYNLYKDALSAGVCAEQARMYLSLNHYTHWLWKQDLHNMMHFLSLRDHSHAQWESQQYAIAIGSLLQEYLPGLMKLYYQYRRVVPE